jgi:WD40 repeat protein
MLMDAHTGQLRRWAAAHAATIPATGRGAAAAPTAASGPVLAGPRPAVLDGLVPVPRQSPMSDMPATCVAGGNWPDGRAVLATGGAGGTARIWDAETGQPLRVLDGHTAMVDSVAWSQAGHRSLLATGAGDGTARVWDPETGECLSVLNATSSGGPVVIAWEAGAGARRLLATTGPDKAIRIWDPDTGRTRNSLLNALGAPGGWNAITWARAADGRARLAVSGASPFVRIWDPDAGRLLSAVTIDSPTRQQARGAVRPANVAAIAYGLRADGELLLAATDGYGVRVWAEAHGTFAATDLKSQPAVADILSWATLDDGRMLLAGASIDTLSLWDGWTFERLRAEEIPARARSREGISWILTRDGRLLLAAASSRSGIQLSEVVLDPPTGPVQPPSHAQAADVTPAGQPRSAQDDSPIRVTAVRPLRDWDSGRLSGFALAVGQTPDGRIIIAADSQGAAVQLWDAGTGHRLLTLNGHQSSVRNVSWGYQDDGRAMLATASWDGTARVWDPETGECLRIFARDRQQSGSRSVAWREGTDGRLLLAVGSADEERVEIWDPGTGAIVQALTTGRGTVSLAWVTRADRSDLLAALSRNLAVIAIWDPETGRQLVVLDQDAATYTTAWHRYPDGRLLLATSCSDGTRIRTSDEDLTEWADHICRGPESVSQAWAPLTDGRALLVTTDYQGLHLWDARTCERLHTEPFRATPSGVQNLDWALTPDGNLLLAAGSADNRIHVWEVVLDPPAGPQEADDQESSRPGEAAGTHARLAADNSARLLRLGTGGLWPPLGLIADVVTLTGEPGAGLDPEADSERAALSALCDARLAALSDAGGVARLRDLAGDEPQWGPDARVAFAALLASVLDIPDEYAPPADIGTARLREALADALGGRRGASGGANTPGAAGADPAISPWRPAVTDLVAAAAAISEQVIALLAILGPDACAADPLLPVRLAHRVPQLPALSARELRLLAAATASRPATGATTATGTMTWSPGTAGVARTGPPSRLLPTELALPRDVRAMRLAESQLLYRQHRAPVPPAPEPVTIVLDTTPPTFGPAGNALRLAAHLITSMLWQYRRHPALVTLTDPASSVELRAPADLISLWASATLSDSGAGLATARRTAARLGQPVIYCTHFQTARDDAYFPGPGSRLLTSHQPPDKPPARPASPWHAHLPPNPARAQLTAVAAQLLRTPARTA